MALMSTSAEQMVGATMIFIGMVVFIQELRQGSRLKNFGHRHTEFSGSTLFGMGVLHGIAGSASIFL